MLDGVLGGAVADDHDSLAGIIALEVIEKGLHAREGLVIALAIDERNMEAAGLFGVDEFARLLGEVAIVALDSAESSWGRASESADSCLGPLCRG